MTKEFSFKQDVLPLKDKLYRLALRITQNTAEAEDAVQDTLIRVWEHRQELGQTGSIEPYALTVCRNLALDMAGRAGHGNVQLKEADTKAIPSADRMDQQERLALVRQAMDGLPEVQRSIMQLRDIEGYSYQEVAQVLQITESQVKVYLHRARMKIRQQIEEIEQYGL